MKPFDELHCVFLRMPPSDIAYLKFVLESYDELGVVRTLDVQRGEVVILSPATMAEETELMLGSLQSQIPFVRLDSAPESVTRDWLLAEPSDEPGR